MTLRAPRAFTAPGRAGFTLLELIVVAAVIAVLGSLIYVGVANLRERAQRAQCSANLRALAVAANNFIQQNGAWPQIPAAGPDESSEAYATAWIAALEPFGAPRKTWICPTIQGKLGNPDYLAAGNERVDYIATPFDDKPTTPHEWPRQPWFIETGDVHGYGNLMIFPDGSVSDLKTEMRNAGIGR